MSRLPALLALATLGAPLATAHPALCPPSADDLAPVKCPTEVPLPPLTPVAKASADRAGIGAKIALDPPTLRAGQEVQGTLAATDMTLADSSYADLYRVVGTAGQRYAVTLASDDFDAYLTVGTAANWADVESFETFASDDDGAGGTNARVVFTMAAEGTVYVRANSLGQGETGAYTLAMADAPPVRAPSVAAIRAGQSVEGRLDEGDGQLEDESFADDYTFTARAGQTYEITMTSDDFDAYLSVGTGTGADFEGADSNDDGEADGDGTNARLVFTATASGPMTIRANSLGNGEVGAYTLRLVQK